MQTVKVTLTAEQVARANKASKKKRIWDNYAIIGEVQKSSKIKFVIAAGIRDGVRYINIREFYLRQRDGAWMPGRDGITVPLMIPINDATEIIKPFDEFVKTLYETKDALEIMELEDEENAVYMEAK